MTETQVNSQVDTKTETKLKPCKGCKKPIKASHTLCVACRQRKHRAQKKREAQRETVFCLHCKKFAGYKYKGEKAYRLYCTQACKQAAYREREKIKEVKRVEAERGDNLLKWEFLLRERGLERQVEQQQNDLKDLRIQLKSKSSHINDLLERVRDYEMQINFFTLIIFIVIFVMIFVGVAVGLSQILGVEITRFLELRQLFF